ncbi:hypothetical protein AK812_SmicGene6651 [Symbiodinium microadriaticum]|uniref:Uncharacterized protein n=1 Tax=Symbiodinium microadriaticum TaxID=2951 RepID=A0A1Q9EQI7_SYMMI|nr:hypothetical protein AK812_SmicGene6651 [Symbiodinium microadriaticum]
MKYPSLVRLLRRDQIIPEWSNRPCPHCGAGKLSKLTFYPYRKVWAHRCSAKFCQKYVQPHEFHPIFVQGAGASKTSLQTQASILLCATAAVPQHCLSKIMDVDDKIVSRIYNNLDIARARFVLAHEKRIQYGGSARWEDVEADEVDLGKGLVENYDKPKLNTKWEQWLGVVQRGSPGSLRLIRLDPPLTKPRSPGPGPIRKRDWKPVAKQYLEGRRIVLHTDGARAYKLKLDQVQHCNVVHKKKQVKVNGKATRLCGLDSKSQLLVKDVGVNRRSIDILAVGLAKGGNPKMLNPPNSLGRAHMLWYPPGIELGRCQCVASSDWGKMMQEKAASFFAISHGYLATDCWTTNWSEEPPLLYFVFVPGRLLLLRNTATLQRPANALSVLDAAQVLKRNADTFSSALSLY